MNGKSKSALLCALVLGVAAVSVRSAAAQAPAPAPAAAPAAAAAPAPPPPRHDQKNEEYYKNIQVLKGYPADMIQPSMQFMEISLGVHCVYCHDPDGAKREVDTPLKLRAREMLRMVAEINRTTFAGQNVVNCYTCHRGTPHPVVMPPYNGQPPASTETALPATVPTVDQLLTNYTNVLGGADNLAKVGGRAWKGTVTNMAHLDYIHTERTPTTVTPIEIFAKGADKRMVVQHNINADAVTTYNGAAGWTRAGVNPAVDMRLDVLDVAKLENAVISPGTFRTLLQGLRVVGQDKVGEHTAWVVQGGNANLPMVKLYFDTATSYLLSVVYEQASDFCCHVFRLDYDNWYVVNGVRVPMQWTSNGPRQTILVYKFDSAQVMPLEDTRFVKPAPPPPARGN